MSTSTFSVIGFKSQVGRALRRLARQPGVGVITNVKLTKIGALQYHLQAELEVK